MNDNPNNHNAHEEIIKELGIYVIKATVTLNAGAFGIILANASQFNSYNVQCVLWIFWAGLIFSGAAVGITYYIAQRKTAGLTQLSYIKHMFLMILPTLFSFMLFIFGTAASIIAYN